MVSGYRKGEPIKKAKVFTIEECNNFLYNFDSTNRYILVRKAVFCINLAGGLRGCDLRPLKQGSLKEVQSGLKLTYTPKKERSNDQPIE